MMRRPGPWILFGLLGAAGVVVAIRFFPAAFPIVTLDLAMDREAAVVRADTLARQYGWDPPDARTAATFGQTDPEVQSYVELEAGGRDAFVEFAERGIHQPYVWTVRRFQEGAVEESQVRFTPAGEPYGFRLRLSEDDPGSGNLAEAEARAVADGTAAEWGVDLSFFDLLESSQETQPGGRVDHTFVFERMDATVEDGRFRLRIRVAGERASELAHFVFVPEAFSQRYRDMRSRNDAIAFASQSVFVVLFLLVGGVGGTAFLMRKRLIVWRPALVWGAVTAVLLGLGIVNTLPLSWMGYDPAVSVQTFLAQQLVLAGATAALGAPLLAFIYLAGESLGRRAFPGHLQQWRFWSPQVAASMPALGRTAGAYLLLGTQLGYVVLFYLATSRLEGWWSPAEAVVQPDLLATAQPWLVAVSTSLFAAFWEESAFRAIPIACAALLAARYGRKSLWIWGAVVLQAVVFAAGHANYPQQPAYARVVELTVPALLWGVIYLYYGLVPTILSHFTYNLSLLSIPLFASSAPGILLDRVVVVAAGLAPLLIVVGARLKVGARAKAPEWAYNRAWKPPAAEEPDAEVESGAEAGAESPTPEVSSAARGFLARRKLVYALGVIGVSAWGAGAFSDAGGAPRLTATRSEAIAVAVDTLERRGHAVESWTALAQVASGRGDADQYVFDEAGAEVYESLLGTHLSGLRWIVRFVDFSADPEQRVEELHVHLDAAGEPLRLRHILPEARPGARLEEEDARVAALAAIQARYGMAPESMDEVGAVQTARPERTDWRFTFEDRAVLSEFSGEARLTVLLAGDEIVDVTRFVNVPEEWELARRDGEALRNLLNLSAALVLVLGFAGACVLSVVTWARRGLDTRLFVRAALLAAVALGLGQANSWPATEAIFSPAQPWGLQAGIAAFGGFLGLLVGAGVIGLGAALAHRWLGEGRDGQAEGPASRSLALALGAVLLGVVTLAEWIAGGLPAWPDVTGANSFIPTLAGPLGATARFRFGTTGLLLMSGLARRSGAGLRWRIALWVCMLAAGVFFVPGPLEESVLTWVPAALLGGAVFFALARLGAAAPALMPGIVGTLTCAGLLVQVATGPYPGARLGGVLAVIAVGTLGAGWMREMDTAPRMSPQRPTG
ncbi:MAG: CPBP family intramembrane metalloprotease [Gammaproteobacteria bacterium]|nr:CPBP family intramembrane metalloprotease [Gammaproteobacteria bacterium]